jgi:hypothetical protein
MRYVYAKEQMLNEGINVNDVGFLPNGLFSQGGVTTVVFLKINKKLNIQSDYLEEFSISEVGDRFNYKVCDRCFRRLDTNHFENNRLKKDNVMTKRPSCRDCRKLKDGKKISKADRDKWNQEKPADYSIFKCPICTKRTIVGISKIVLDHNHHTGHVRGWLCESCNTGIGRFDDNPELVLHAINWLKDN